jgi:hypothetical protein
VRSSTHLLALSALSLLALGAAACGSDKADTSATSIAADTTATSIAAVAAPAVDVAAYCTAEAAVEQGGQDLGDPDADTKAAATAFLPLAQRVHDLAPPELTAVFDEAIAAVQATIESGTTDALDSLDLSEAHAYDVAHCGWATTAVKTEDFKFVGLPESLTAGTYNFEVTNEGTEPHLLIIVKKKAGVTATFEDIMADPSAESMLDTVTATFDPPGGNSHAVATLEPGEYLALCPISKGTTMTAEGTGEPHFMLGMQQVITVTA